MAGYAQFGYFGVFPGAAPGLAPAPVVTGMSAAAVIADVAARLLATGEFAEVSRNRPFEAKGNHSSGEGVAADVSPGSPWSDLDTTDDGAGVRIEDSGRLTVTIAVREEDEWRRFCVLNRLENLTRNLLNGQALAGATVPGRTLCRRGSYPAAEPPEQRAAVVVEFEMLIEGYGGFDTTLVD